MQTIKFDHKYIKMPEDMNDTKLIEVFKTNYYNLSPWFRVYDTEYSTGYYKLPQNDLLVLILISYEENVSGGLNEYVWTTIRNYTPEKEQYYRNLRGQNIDIRIEETPCH